MPSEDTFAYLSDDIIDQINKYRQKYGVGGAFVSILVDQSLVIPWRPLSLQSYLRFSELQRLRQNEGILEVCLEDEIFLSCVLDDVIKKRIDYLKAGIVQLVVSHIWAISCPVNAEELDATLNHRRALTWDAHNAILHEFVKWITLAFPYKPEEVYAMPFEQMSKVLIMAEQKLMLMGLLDKPFQVLLEQPQQERREQPREKVDPRKMWEEIHGVEAPSSITQEDIPQSIRKQNNLRDAEAVDEATRERLAAAHAQIGNFQVLEAPQQQPYRQSWRDALKDLRQQQQKGKVESVLLPPERLPPEIMNDPNVSPIIKYGGLRGKKRKQGTFVSDLSQDGAKVRGDEWLNEPVQIDLAAEERKQLGNLGGHDLMELDVARAQMVKEAQEHYADVLKYLAERRAIVAEQQRKQREKK